jgi:hypothetical protein
MGIILKVDDVQYNITLSDRLDIKKTHTHTHIYIYIYI